jgi:sarcosine oxidase
MNEYDAIVVGVGGMGSATVYHLARLGAKVLGIERFNIPHEMGSSHGVNRIIRLAYWEHPAYVPLLRRAYELWREIEHQSGERLLVITGSVDAGLPDTDIVKGALLSCEVHHLPHQRLDGKSLHERFHGYNLPPDMTAVYQPDGGFVLSERGVVAYVLAAQHIGATVHAREEVVGIDPSDRGVSVRTDRGVYRADRVVVTAGPWTATLLANLGKLAQPERQALLWTQPLRTDLFRLGAFPVFNIEVPEGRFYGFPIYGVPGFKLGKYHHRGEKVDPDRMNRETSFEDEEILRVAVRRYFPAADGPTMALKTCLFTNTPDEHFILDLHSESPRVAVAAGFSGHGFKFCSVVGEIMADLAMDGGTRWDIGLFRLSRFSALPHA